MDLVRARFLASVRGRTLLERYDGTLDPSDPVRMATELRRELSPDEAAAIGEQIALRARARRLGRRDDLLLTGDGLEMMTPPEVAARRAARLAGPGLPVADLTTGLGGDLRAIAETGARTVGLERDPVVARLAAANAPGAFVAIGTAEQPPVDVAGTAVFIDPMRRAGGRRTWAPAAMQPSWDCALDLARRAPLAAIKTAPGLPAGHRPPDAEVEVVQLGRSLRELTCWFGVGTRAGLRHAVIAGVAEDLDSDDPGDETVIPEIGPVLFDPAPCVTVAGLVPQLAARLGARPFDERVGYLAGPKPVPSPYARSFEVVEVVPFNLKRLRRRLVELGLRPVEALRRAFPVEPEELLSRLAIVEGEPVTLIVTTRGRDRLAIIARPATGMSGNV